MPQISTPATTISMTTIQSRSTWYRSRPHRLVTKRNRANADGTATNTKRKGVDITRRRKITFRLWPTAAGETVTAVHHVAPQGIKIQALTVISVNSQQNRAIPFSGTRHTRWGSFVEYVTFKVWCLRLLVSVAGVRSVGEIGRLCSTDTHYCTHLHNNTAINCDLSYSQ
jgi:hypothetical protein